MRFSSASSIRFVAAAATALTVAGVGAYAAAGSQASPASPADHSSHASNAGRAVDPGAIIVHPTATHIRGVPDAPVPLTDSQCEALLSIQCYVPDQVEAAYNLPALYNRGITGKGRTIVIVDAFGSPSISDDLLGFDQALGLGFGAPPLRVIQVGHVPQFDANDGNMVGWAGETTLDVEWSHAGAPGAQIVLVEVANDQLKTLALGVQYAVQHRLGDVISLSWGLPEQTLGRSFVSSYSYIFQQAANAHITVVASSGDSGASGFKDNGHYYPYPVASWPATSPYVTAIGGTQLNLNASGTRNGLDAAWNDTYSSSVQQDAPSPLATGGGKSVDFARPGYQNSVGGITGPRRGIPDISMSASCSVAVNTYESFPGPNVSGWLAECGTSESAPMFAAIVALADQMAGHSLGLINPALYTLAARHAPGIVPVGSGNNTVTFGSTTVHGYTVRRGYNLCTGLGTVNGQYLVPELARR